MRMTGRQANILDPIHDTLPPEVWDDAGAEKPRLKAIHQRWIINNVHRQARTFHEHPEQWLQMVLTGSLTTYQYSETSDCDVSLFVSPHFLPEWDRAKLIGLMIDHMDGTTLPGTPYQMQCFVVAKNIGMHDLYQPGLRSGYDIIQQKWLQPPEKDRAHDVEREYNVDYIYALESADKMERLLRYEPDKAIQFWHQIHKRRMRDQKSGKGDFSQANIVYKFLANRELFPQIAQVSGEYIARYGALPKDPVTGMPMKSLDPHGRSVFAPADQTPFETPWQPGKMGKGFIYMQPTGKLDFDKGYYPSEPVVKHWQTDEFGWPHHVGYAGPERRQNKMPGSDFYIAPDGKVAIARPRFDKDTQQAHEILEAHGFEPIHNPEKYNPFDPMANMEFDADDWLDANEETG